MRDAADKPTRPEAGLPRTAEEKARWQEEENAEGIRPMNAWVEKHGLPLAKHRRF